MQTKPKETPASHITEAEWTLMRALWAEKELTSRKLIDTVLTTNPWKEGTIKSLLSRLVEKGCVEKDTSHTPYLFRPLIGEQEAIHAKMDAILQATCQQQIGKQLHALIADSPLSQGDIQKMLTSLQRKLETAPTVVPCNCPAGLCNCQVKGEHHEEKL